MARGQFRRLQASVERNLVATEFKLPELGENIESGDVVRIAVTSGETISPGETVVELETDKAVVEVPSTVSGVIEQVVVTPSQRIKVGDVLFTYTAMSLPSPPRKSPPKGSRRKRSRRKEPPQKSPPRKRARGRARRSASGRGGRARRRRERIGRRVPIAGARREYRIRRRGSNRGAAGRAVTAGQTVLELETDKAVVEVPSTVNGTVSEVRARLGQKLKAGEPIFTFVRAAAAEPPASAAAPSQPNDKAPLVDNPSDDGYMAMTRHSFQAARSAEGKSELEAFPPDVPPEMEFEVHPAGLGKHAGHEHRTVPAAPIVRKLAREIGVEIDLVKGTGPGGRISEADVKAFAKGAFARMADSEASVRMASVAGGLAVKLPDFSRWGKVEKVSLRAVRRKTAEHLALAWNVIPHVTQFDKADVSDLEELRKRFAPKAEAAGGKMTMTAIALKVAASALKAFPQFNASIDMAGEEIIYKRYINIGVAVDTDRGLLVPVIRDVDKKNIIELAVELSTLSNKARDKKLAAEDMEGGSFTITNLGGIGGTAFTPIVNHPEVAILGMSRSRIEPVWVQDKDKFEPRTVLPLSVSYDHRIIDGADAARFTRWIVDALEQPFLLSVQG